MSKGFFCSRCSFSLLLFAHAGIETSFRFQYMQAIFDQTNHLSKGLILDTSQQKFRKRSDSLRGMFIFYFLVKANPDGERAGRGLGGGGGSGVSPRKFLNI